MNELLQMLNNLNIYNSHENVLMLDSNTIQRIFSDFIPKILTQKQIKILNTVQIPDDVLEKNFLRLLMACKYMCEKMNIHDFSYNDLVDPDVKRIKVLLTELAKFAIFKQKMNLEIVPTYNHYVQQYIKHEQLNAANYLQELVEQTQSSKNQLLEERDYSKQLQHQYNEKLKLLRTAESTYQTTKQSVENLRQIYLEEQGKFSERQKQLSQSSDQLFILFDKKKQFQSRVVGNSDELEQKYRDSVSNVESYQNEFSQELKLKNLLEFKVKIFDMFLSKLRKVVKNLNNMQQDVAKQLQSNDSINNHHKELKYLENQRLELSKVIQRAKEHVTLKDQGFIERQIQFSEIKAQQQSLIQSLENDIMVIQELVDVQVNQIIKVQLEKRDKQQNILNLAFQLQDLYTNSRNGIQQIIQEIDSYSSAIDSQLNLIFD